MYSQLLVPLDGSGFGEETFPFAEALARSTGAALSVAHVHVPHVPDHLISNTQYQFEGVDMAEYDGRDREAEETYLRGVAERLAARVGTGVDPVLLDGTVPEAIEDFASGREAPGVIVMATHGRSGFSRAWLGSVADAVVRHAPWPVLLIRPGMGADFTPRRGFRRILVTLDGSERAERILPHAAELARACEGTLELLRVVTPTAAGGTAMLPVSEAALAEARRRAEHYLEGVADRLRERGLGVEVKVVEDTHPAKAILDVMEQDRPDLVAMATHGYRGVTRVVLGSVADKVLRGGTTPLLLLGPAVGA